MPLLFYIVIAIENKKKLSRRDWLIIIFVSAGMFFGLLLQFIRSLEASIAVILVAVSLVGVDLLLLVLGDHETVLTAGSNPYSGLGDNHSMSKQRKKLALQLLYFFPSFLIVYLLSLSRAINHDTTAVLFMVCNTSTKIVFVAILMASHVEVLYVLFVAETHLNDAKRAFLRYIMHEVRVPLNSITMGIGLLEESSHLDEGDRQSLRMMKSSTGFIQETLNDVLSMQKIEEGKLELTPLPFIVEDMVHVVKAALHGSLSDKNIQLFISISEDVPKFVIGDRFRIEHVLANLLSNAIKFSPINGRIFVTVSLYVSVN